MNLFYFLKGSDPFSGIIKYGIIVLACFHRDFYFWIDCWQFCQLRDLAVWRRRERVEGPIVLSQMQTSIVLV